MVWIRDDLDIPERELRFTTSRSSGPGGQNVNKVESRVTLHFDIEASESLSDGQRASIRGKLSTRINSDEVLQISSQTHPARSWRTARRSSNALPSSSARLSGRSRGGSPRRSLAPHRSGVSTRSGSRVGRRHSAANPTSTENSSGRRSLSEWDFGASLRCRLCCR